MTILKRSITHVITRVCRDLNDDADNDLEIIPFLFCFFLQFYIHALGDDLEHALIIVACRSKNC